MNPVCSACVCVHTYACSTRVCTYVCVYMYRGDIQQQGLTSACSILYKSACAHTRANMPECVGGERDKRQRQRQGENSVCMYVCMYIYIERERARARARSATCRGVLHRQRRAQQSAAMTHPQSPPDQVVTLLRLPQLYYSSWWLNASQIVST
jgi:hypothetical protein